MSHREPQISIVTVGHVDHGKSTLIGRLLHETGNLPDGKVDELRAASDARGVAFEWSFVLDALQSERDQAITIDTTRIWLRDPRRDIVLIDAPGHKEFLRNMITGASNADAALLVIDAVDGVSEQTRRHALLLELIGITSAVVVVNKMDRVDYAQARYVEIRAEIEALLERIGVVASAVIPASARDGDNVTRGSDAMPWYGGPPVFDALLAVEPREGRGSDALRVTISGVLRRDLSRILMGSVESGSLSVGDEVMISPSRRTARIASIESWPPSDKQCAAAGESVAFTLDGPHFVDRGYVIGDRLEPPCASSAFDARLLWLGREPLKAGDRFRIRIGTRQASVEVTSISRTIDIDTLQPRDAETALTNDVVDARFRSREVIALDPVSEHPALGRFILLDGLDIVAGGTVQADITGGVASNLVPVDHLLDVNERSRRNGHRGAVIWLTGLPASGKSTIAMELERRLFERGFSTYVLDGDNVRAGLCSDLGFSPQDRRENIRRVGEVAALFADAGTIAITAFISPYADDRDLARRAAGADFHEIYVDADVAVCESRDPKGHYKRARAGEIADFTGVTGEYEVPREPELVLHSGTEPVDVCVAELLNYIEKHVALRQAKI